MFREILWKKQANNATVDKSIIRERQKLRGKQQQKAINPAQKDALGLDTKGSC